MSSTRDLSVALEYSGAKQGRVATVLPPPPSPLSHLQTLFAAFSHRSSTKACRCTSETLLKRVGFAASLAPPLSQVPSPRHSAGSLLTRNSIIDR
jgi:hypothetical protein